LDLSLWGSSGGEEDEDRGDDRYWAEPEQRPTHDVDAM